ncbi:class I SAM-dependent methyltransferase [Synechococcus sp. CCY 0621]|uniref:class I SAM-dependent methyltransferase n=1 Tax=Synechococcus sp. CCY 0621 TaxID=2815603 RepID=UPI001C2296AA
MAHEQQLYFVSCVQKSFPQFFADAKVLEIGSLDICGSVRKFFSNCSYIGVDVAPGEGVDVVCQGQDYDAQDGSFDHVISCEAMEHNPMWKETFINMVRLVKPGGLLTMTCASYCRPEHGTTRTSSVESSPLSVSIGWEYYRNLGIADFKSVIDFDSRFSFYRFWTNWKSKDLYLVAIRRNGPNNMQIEKTFSEVDRWIAIEAQAVIYRFASLAASLAGERGANIVLRKPLSSIIWQVEASYYKALGWASRLIKGS